MSGHVLLITLGPVQDFIAQARRTRDLWFGSHLLSELSRCVARYLAENGAELVFPCLEKGHPELEPCPKMLRSCGTSPLNVANKILAIVPQPTAPESMARGARGAVHAFWQEIAEKVKREQADLLAPELGMDAAWTEQIETTLEFSATWTAFGDYASARKLVESAIASRKNLRDFSTWKDQRGNVPKSSLDGARETVLAEPQDHRRHQIKFRDKKLARRYRIADAEQLDAVGLIKRTGGAPNQFVPLVNVALASWISFARAVQTAAEFPKLEAACKQIGIAEVRRPDLACGKLLGFDATVLLTNRWRTMFEEQGLGDGSAAAAWGRKYVQPLLHQMSEPYPYVTCLVADGDHMGKVINQIADVALHQEFSRALARFASNARHIVEQDHRGSLVYSGGDDVVAFVPLPDALQSAAALRRDFDEAMKDACVGLPVDVPRPTLSIGLGIGHVMEGMGDLLALGRRAEKLAKGAELAPRDRNALAVLVDKRAGGSREWRAQWTEKPVEMLLADIAHARTPIAIAGREPRLSTRKIYEVEKQRKLFPVAAQRQDPQIVLAEKPWFDPLLNEVRRCLSRTEDGVLDDEVQLFGVDLDSLRSSPTGVGQAGPYARLNQTIRDWVDRVLIARCFVDAEPRTR